MDDDAQLRALFAALESDSARADATYRALKSTGALKSHRLLTYRCPKRCMLLDVVNLPAPVGLIVHSPRYRLSPGLNAASSSASGRAKNTEDGDNHWKAHTFPVRAMSRPLLTCDHLRVPLEDVDFEADLEARHAEVVMLPTGERRPR